MYFLELQLRPTGENNETLLSEIFIINLYEIFESRKTTAAIVRSSDNRTFTVFLPQHVASTLVHDRTA